MNKVIIIILFCFVFFCVFFYEYKNESFDNNGKIYEIKDIKPKHGANLDAKIAFVYFYTPNIYDYCQHSIRNIMTYCNKYNYAFIAYDTPFNEEVSMCWNKIAAILQNLHKYDVLVWIDADAIINNMNITIESILQMDLTKELYVCEDIQLEYECINSGVMIIKNTEWTEHLFRKVWNSPIPHGHNDQNVIFLEIAKEMHPELETKQNETEDTAQGQESILKKSPFCNRSVHPKVGIYSENLFNTHIYHYKPDNFILHLMGYNTASRINVMRQINTKLGLDQYSHKDCIQFIDSKDELDTDMDTETRNNKIKEICERREPST